MADVTTINPATGREIQTYTRTAESDLAAAVEGSVAAFDRWRGTSASERADVLETLAAGLERESGQAAATITEEMGKPISQAEAEIEKCVNLCRHYARNAAALLAPEEVDTEAAASYVRFDPLGPVLGIMPWNFPYWQVFRWGIPTALAGNTLLLKHADNVQAAARHIGSLFEEAFPGLLTNLCLSNEITGQLIEDARVRGVSLTGSVRAGRSVAAAAGKTLKPSVLELGGSDPALILPDADLDTHMEAIVQGRFQNTGQTCIASKRYLVHADIAEDFTDRLVGAANGLRVGDPMDGDTEIGPMARRDLRNTLNDQLMKCVADGLRVAVAGGLRDGDGFFFDPVVLTDVKPETTPFREELFGPVASVCTCQDEDQMVEWANATDYGLSASVWTQDREAAESLAGRLDVGCVFTNAAVKSDVRLPFGGVKDSGYGRELGGYGVRQFCNAKTVWVA